MYNQFGIIQFLQRFLPIPQTRNCSRTSFCCFLLQTGSKDGFFSEIAMCFSNLQKKYSNSLSWTWNLNFPSITVNNNFKFQAQDSNLEYFYFGDLEIWKTSHTFWKKATFSTDCPKKFNMYGKSIVKMPPSIFYAYRISEWAGFRVWKFLHPQGWKVLKN